MLGFSDTVWGQFLALAAGLAMLLRARLFRYTSQVTCVLAAGISAIALLVLGLSLNPPADLVRELLTYGDRGALDIRTIWLAACVAAGAALITAIGLIVPHKGLSPFWEVAPRSRRRRGAALAGTALSGGPRRLHRGPRPHQLDPVRADRTQVLSGPCSPVPVRTPGPWPGARPGAGTLCDGRLCT